MSENKPDMTRRRVLKIVGSIAFMTSMGPTVGCTGPRRIQLRPSDSSSAQIPELNRDIAAILFYASLAPSMHNTQPWTVRILDKETWIIGWDPKRRLPVADPENRGLLLAIGAFIENLALAAGAFGYDAQTEILATTPEDAEIVRVVLRRGRSMFYPLDRLVLRRTLRKRFISRTLATKDIRYLSKTYGEGILFFPPGSEQARSIQNGTIEALRAQTLDDHYQKELILWVRWAEGEARVRRDGLTTDSMEIPGILGWYARKFLREEILLTESYRKRGIEVISGMAKQGGGWLIITSKGSSVKDLIETGRRFERVFLVAREQGVALHPMSYMLENSALRRELASIHGSEGNTQFILRVGYVEKYPPPVSLRRPLRDFLRI